jgi:membrane protein DedA with SNARE-associated domain/rhodanese-related sulfurtransferase
MPIAVDFFLQYGYLILFLWVGAEQLGVPVPSIPLLIAAGAISATRHMSIAGMLLAVVAACAVSDTVWFNLGRRFGGKVVRLLCRLSLETDTCVKRTENIFTKHGPAALLIAKFMPGLNSVAAPIAGESGMQYSRFIAWDLAGATLWATAFLLAGRLFGDTLKKYQNLGLWTGRLAGFLFVAAILGFLIYRVVKQRRFLTQVRNARLEPEELMEMIESGHSLYIVDLRHPLDYVTDPRTLPGAVRLLPNELMSHSKDIPRDRDIVLFCTCPSEQTSGRVALQMRSIGIHRVRPLRGGFEAWREKGLPLVDYVPPAAPAGGVGLSFTTPASV